LSAIPLIKESLEILMEYAPGSIDPKVVTASLTSFSHVHRVEKLYIWTITSNQVMLCAHLLVKLANAEDQESLLKQLHAHLHQEFGISEAILQLTSYDYQEPATLHPLLMNDLVSLLKREQEESGG
jgi:cobalt-zinc-cadmium efflux system protein